MAGIVRYAVVIERGPASYGASVPDLPGCVAAGTTRDEVLALIRGAIELHLDALRREGREVPPPRCDVEYVGLRAERDVAKERSRSARGPGDTLRR